MNEKEKRIFLSLLKSAVLGVALPENEKADFSYEMLPKFYALSKKHTISHLIAVGLEANGFSSKENEFCEKFQKQKFSAFFRQEKINYHFEKQCEVLEKEQIPFVPLKGAVIKEFYPESWMRTSSDVDILVKEKDLKKAENALKEQLSYTGENRAHYHNVSLFSEDGVHLELHFSIKEAHKNIDVLLEKAWDYAKPKDDGRYLFTFDNEFFMFYIVSHIYYHFMTGGCGIKSIIDLMLLKEKMPFDEEKLLEMCEQCGIKQFYISLIELANVWFENGEHSELTLFLEKFIFDGGVFGNTTNNTKIKSARQNGRIKNFLEKVFLPTHLMLASYPILKRHIWLLPFCHIARIFRLVFSGKAVKKVRGEVRANSMVDSSEIDKAGEFLKQLGLK